MTKRGSGVWCNGLSFDLSQLNLAKDATLGAGHGVSVETPSVQNALDKLREENFLWRSQRGSYAVEDEQFLEWLAQDRDLNGIP